MAKASAGQVAAWVQGAGFTGTAAVTATAIALAAGSDPAKPGGLFGVGGGDGAAQAAAAFAAYRSGGFGSFPAYSHGSWALYEPTAAAAVATLPAAPARIPTPPDLPTIIDKATGPLSASATGLEAIGNVFGFIADSTNWQRITKVGLGLALMIIGAANISWTTVTKPALTLFKKADSAIADYAPLADMRAPNNPRP